MYSYWSQVKLPSHEIHNNIHATYKMNHKIKGQLWDMTKVATDTKVLYLRTRYRSKYASIFGSSRYKDTIHLRQICKFCISEPIQDTKWGGSFGSDRYTWRYVATLPSIRYVDLLLSKTNKYVGNFIAVKNIYVHILDVDITVAPSHE